MKEHGNKQHPAEPAAKTLKSLLKKPGQTKAKSQKHRVVINEKLNEFFAADYIILIKEECCADYEEDCDCCYQEHEFMRLGNCKECRAELNLHFGIGAGTGTGTGTGNGRYGGEMTRGVEQTFCENAVRGDHRGGGTRGKSQQGREDTQTEEDEEEDEEEADDGEEEEDEEEEREEEEEDEEENVDGKVEKVVAAAAATTATSVQERKDTKNERVDADDATKGRRTKETTTADSQEESGTVVPPPPPPPRHDQQQQETLSPPEGYKDVCSDSEIANETEQRGRPSASSATCTECNYYQQQAPGKPTLVVLLRKLC